MQTWGAAGRRCIISCVLTLSSASCAQTQQRLGTITGETPEGGGIWYCVNPADEEYGRCAPDPETCELWRQEAGGGACKTQQTAWCFGPPHGKAAEVTCVPTADECGLARKRFIDQTEQPPLTCQERLAPKVD